MKKIEIKLDDLFRIDKEAILLKIDEILDLLELVDDGRKITFEMILPDDPKVLTATFGRNDTLLSLEVR